MQKVEPSAIRKGDANKMMWYTQKGHYLLVDFNEVLSFAHPAIWINRLKNGSKITDWIWFQHMRQFDSVKPGFRNKKKIFAEVFPPRRPRLAVFDLRARGARGVSAVLTSLLNGLKFPLWGPSTLQTTLHHIATNNITTTNSMNQDQECYWSKQDCAALYV